MTGVQTCALPIYHTEHINSDDIINYECDLLILLDLATKIFNLKSQWINSNNDTPNRISIVNDVNDLYNQKSLLSMQHLEEFLLLSDKKYTASTINKILQNQITSIHQILISKLPNFLENIIFW